jgi:hypothetical protein
METRTRPIVAAGESGAPPRRAGLKATLTVRAARTFTDRRT